MTTHDDRLADLLVAWDEAEERGEKPTIAEICRDCPELAGPLAELLRTLGRVEDALEQTVPFAPPARVRLPRVVGRYRLTRVIGQGGLGDVYGADDTELPREVAVKLIRAEAAGDDARRRFAHEAAITSQLDHPGVVPVFGFHAPEGGPPYYAMRLIRGRSLAEEIAAHFAAEPGRAAEETARELRRLLGSFVAACQTIAFAHSRGVIHRDLKPQNIMVGPYGETLVVDWGLAKRIGEDETKRSDERSIENEPTLLPQHDTDRRQGETGTVGTLEYMSPEQFHGEATRASDIYSLGATLWKLLAGQSRLTASSDSERLRLVAAGHYVPPEKVRAGVPPGLSAICRRAMAADSAARYASVGELIDDVEAWLADAPVAAYPDPWHVRLRRWVVAHLPFVSAAGGLLVAAFVALAIIAALVRAHNEKIEADAEQLRQNYALAHQATREMVLVAVQNKMLLDAAHNPLRKEILEQAIRYYRRALELQPGSLQIRRELALATLFLGLTDHHLGQKKEIPAALREAERQYRELAAEHPGDLDLAYGHICSVHVLAGAEFEMGDHPAAVAGLMSAYEAVDRLDRDAVPKTDAMFTRRVLGEPNVLQAEALVRLQMLVDLGAAADHKARIHAGALEVQSRLAAQDRAAGGKNLDLRAALARFAFSSANAAFLKEDLAATERDLLEALQYLLEPPRAETTLPDALLEIQIQMGLARIYLSTDRNKEAVAVLEPAFVRLLPYLENFDSILAQNQLPPRTACEVLQRLMDVSVRLIDAEYLEAASGVGPALANVTAAADREARQLRRMKTIAQTMPALVRHFPQVAAADPVLLGLAMKCADELLKRGQQDDALAVLAALETLIGLKLAEQPRSFELRSLQAQVLVGRGVAWSDKGNAATALPAFTAARREIVTLLAEKEDALLRELMLPCLIFSALQLPERPEPRQMLDLATELVPAAERVLGTPRSQFGANHARVALTISASACIAVLTDKTLPPTAEEQASARRLGLAALDLAEKHQVPLEDAKTFRAALEGKAPPDPAPPRRSPFELPPE